MVVADSKQSLTITGNGDVLEPHDGVIGTIGSGRPRSACTKACFLKYTDILGHFFWSRATYGVAMLVGKAKMRVPPSASSVRPSAILLNRGRLAAAIGSGGGYALAAARALIDMPDLTAMAVGAPCCDRRLGFAIVPAMMIRS